MNDHDRIHSDNTRDRSRGEQSLTSDELGERWGVSHRTVDIFVSNKGLRRNGRYFDIDDILAFEKKWGTKNFHRRF